MPQSYLTAIVEAFLDLPATPVTQGPEQPPTPPRSVVSENSRGTEVSRPERQSEGAETNRGSLSHDIVAIETAETDSRKRGSSEGCGQTVGMSASDTLMGPEPMQCMFTRRRHIDGWYRGSRLGRSAGPLGTGQDGLSLSRRMAPFRPVIEATLEEPDA